MQETYTSVQLPRNTRRESLWSSVADPVDIGGGEAVERMTLDVRVADAEFLGQLAEYRNAIAAAKGVKLKRKWTRKSVAESFLAAQCDVMREQMKKLLATLGPLPSADEEDAMSRYAKRVVALDSKNNK